MHTEAQCQAALDEFHRHVADMPGVQGVGIQGSGNRCSLVLYVSGEQADDVAYPNAFRAENHPPDLPAFPVTIREVGSIKPLGT